MKIHVRVGEETFEVEVGDVGDRPVVAIVDGMRFEVWPEGPGAEGQAGSAVPGPNGQAVQRTVEKSGTPAARPGAASVPCAPAEVGHGRLVRAPIPGVIDSIVVRPGDSVARGGELVVLEAMKMKNVIQAPQAGTVAAIHVAVGQHVKHGDLLVEMDR